MLIFPPLTFQIYLLSSIYISCISWDSQLFFFSGNNCPHSFFIIVEHMQCVSPGKVLSPNVWNPKSYIFMKLRHYIYLIIQPLLFASTMRKPPYFQPPPLFMLNPNTHTHTHATKRTSFSSSLV